MNRWKNEGERVEIVRMYAHNRWSYWGYSLLEAAEDLGCLIGEYVYPAADNSAITIWYTSSLMLSRVGGWEAVENLAHFYHEGYMDK